MTSLVVLCPVLDRPHRAQPVADSLYETTGGEATLVFLCSPGDDAEIAACRKVRGATTIIVPFERGPGDYARKINYGIANTSSDLIFQGADDLRFHPDWLQHAERVLGRGREIGVVGTQDLGNRLVKFGRHSTHSLVTRAYVERGTVDEPGKLMHEGYCHNFVDTEMVETAMHRRAWAFAKLSVVEHLHPHWPDGKGGQKGEMDATYELGLGDFRTDQLRFFARRKLWAKGRPQTRR